MINEDMTRYRERVEETVSFLRARLSVQPEYIIVLGTGLSGVADAVLDARILPYAEIPNFPRATVTSHAGNLVTGTLNSRPVAILQGRFHYYEGYSTRELTFPIRVLALLGARTLLVTNSAGGLNPSYVPGTIMVIRDHLNLISDNPLRGPNIDAWGPRFPDFSETYDRRMIAVVCECAVRLGLANVTTGVYAAIPGPSLETPAETAYLRKIGGDAVGMSTVPEVIVAKHAGMAVLGLSVIANVNRPEDFKPISVDDIIEQAKKTGADLTKLILAALGEL